MQAESLQVGETCKIDLKRLYNNTGSKAETKFEKDDLSTESQYDALYKRKKLEHGIITLKTSALVSFYGEIEYHWFYLYIRNDNGDYCGYTQKSKERRDTRWDVKDYKTLLENIDSLDKSALSEMNGKISYTVVSNNPEKQEITLRNKATVEAPDLSMGSVDDNPWTHAPKEIYHFIKKKLGKENQQMYQSSEITLTYEEFEVSWTS